MEVNERDKEKRWREYRDVLNDDNSGVTNIKSVLSHQKMQRYIHAHLFIRCVSSLMTLF